MRYDLGPHGAHVFAGRQHGHDSIGVLHRLNAGARDLHAVGGRLFTQ